MDLATTQNNLNGALVADGIGSVVPAGTTIDQFVRWSAIAMVHSKDLGQADQD